MAVISKVQEQVEVRLNLRPRVILPLRQVLLLVRMVVMVGQMDINMTMELGVLVGP